MAFDISLIDLGADVGRTPQREAPTLAALTRQIYNRPLWMMREAMPLQVDLETYKRGREEMVEIQKARGFPLATAVNPDVPRENFLLRGIPVVIKDEA